MAADVLDSQSRPGDVLQVDDVIIFAEPVFVRLDQRCVRSVQAAPFARHREQIIPDGALGQPVMRTKPRVLALPGPDNSPVRYPTEMVCLRCCSVNAARARPLRSRRAEQSPAEKLIEAGDWKRTRTFVETRFCEILADALSTFLLS